jgi:CheY-like chemotaxis protein
LGLGLAIVDRLAALLGHPLGMRSAPGVGSVFRLTLPLGDAVALAAEPAIDAAISEDLPLRVLVIEDELHVQEAMSVLLRSWGHEVVAVVAEEAALAIFPPAPDVIIADYRLREDRTGIDAIRRVRDQWGTSIPSLVVTGDTSVDRLQQAQASGLAFLHKPVSPGKLRAFLRGVQRERRARTAA